MIFSFVSITKGYSFLSWEGFFWTDGETTVRASPAAPSVRFVTNPPISPIDRRTPPSAVIINHDK